MDFREASARQQGIVASLVRLITELFRPFKLPELTDDDWASLMRATYPHVAEARRQSAELAREFYDSQRYDAFGETRNTYLANYEFEWFAEAMEPARGVIVDPDAPDAAVAQVALTAAKEVENGWRRTMIRAVQSDPNPRRVRWARVATGRETCEFCLTMISRGAVYLSAKSAGLNADETKARELFRLAEQNQGEGSQLAAEEMDALMTRWHVGCDCRVVPVFDEKNWPGREEFLRAQEVWKRYSRLVEENPELLKPSNGNQHTKGDREWTRNEAIIAAIRRALENGELDMRDYAAAA